MKPYPECGLCVAKWTYERVTPSLSDKQRFPILAKLMRVVAEEMDPSVNLAIICNRALAAVHDLRMASYGDYEELKRKSNEAAERLLTEAKAFIENSETPRAGFVKACGLAAVGNVAPIGLPSGPFEFPMVEDIIRGKAPLPVVSGDLYGAASRARNVFYVADNAGEIGFDSLLISLLRKMGAKVTLVVKEAPFFDDATLEDVRYFGLEHRVDALHSVRGGIFVPHHTGAELDPLFETADLIVSKGTGNFEALKGQADKKPTLFLLKAKCGPVSKETSTPKGQFAVRLED
jgi:damage-control phosphatase, subfamily I